MSEFTPTAEQAAIVEAAKSSKDNLLVSALAGAAKTSSLILVAEALKSTHILCLAFNKRIAVEMQDRLPGNCESMTLNSLGHRAWSNVLGRRLILEAKKNYKNLRGLVDDLRNSEKEEAYEEFAETLRAIEFAKTCGFVPKRKAANAKPLMDADEFFSHMEIAPTPLQERLITAAMEKSIEQAWSGEVDFDDQIYMSTLFGAPFPQYPLVLVDEAQDLSALNHAMLRRLTKKRLIAVGDECQSIYGFRGAHEDSMRLLQKEFDMNELVLSISFRCPQAVVREAQWRAPHMRWPDWAIEGAVESWDEWTAESVPQDAVILCRNNAPLFSMAIALLKNGRYPELVGNDIGRALIRTLKKFGETRLPQKAVFEAITSWEREKLQRARNKAKIHDQVACLRIFAEQGRDLGEAIAYAEHLIERKGTTKLMTGHKSKGLEFPTVIILDKHLVRTREAQDRNLLYVMQTRAKEHLIYATSDGFQTACGDADGGDALASTAE